MRYYLIFTVVLLSMFPNAHSLHGQTFAYAHEAAQQPPGAWTPATLREHRERMMPGPITAVGGCLMGVATVVTVYGFIHTLDGYQHGNVVDQGYIDNGQRLEVAGIVMFAVGTGMMIGGAIHDHSKNRPRRWGIAAPNGNDMGVAYNFR